MKNAKRIDPAEMKAAAIQRCWDEFVAAHQAELEAGNVEAAHVFQAGWNAARLFDHEIDLQMGDMMLEIDRLKKQIKEMSH